MAEHPRIDIAITATLRPEILARTLGSLREHLFGDWPTRAVINVDPIGEPGVTASEVLQVAQAHCDEVLSRCPPTPRYPDSWRWVWANTTSDYVFWPLDDNMLLRPVDLQDMIERMREHRTLAMLRLPEWDTAETEGRPTIRQWNLEVPWDAEKRLYWMTDIQRGKIGVAGKASLAKGWFLRECARWMDASVNPEKQHRVGSRSGRLLRHVGAWDYAIYAKPGDTKAFTDIGVEWRKRYKMDKDIKAFMTGWEQRQEGA